MFWILGAVLGLGVLVGLWLLVTRDQSPPEDADLVLEIDLIPAPPGITRILGETVRALYEQRDLELQGVYDQWLNSLGRGDLEPPSRAELERLFVAQEEATKYIEELLDEPRWHTGFDPRLGLETLTQPVPWMVLNQWVNSELRPRIWLAKQDHDREAMRSELAKLDRATELVANSDVQLVSALLAITWRRIYLSELERAWVDRDWVPTREDIPAPLPEDLITRALKAEYMMVCGLIDELAEDMPGRIGGVEIGPLQRVGGVKPNRSKHLAADIFRWGIARVNDPSLPDEPKPELAQTFEENSHWVLARETLLHRNPVGILVLSSAVPGTNAVGKYQRLCELQRRCLELASLIAQAERELGSPPETLELLVEAGLIEEVPIDPTDGTRAIRWDATKRLLWGTGSDHDPLWQKPGTDALEFRKQDSCSG